MLLFILFAFNLLFHTVESLDPSSHNTSLIKRDDDNELYQIASTKARTLCNFVFSGKTIKHKFRKLNNGNVTYQEELQELKAVSLQQKRPLVKFKLERDIRRPEWIYFFAFYCAYTYCPSAKNASLMAYPNPDLGNRLLPTSNFKIATWQEFKAYNGKYQVSDTPDGRFYIAVNPELELITLSWRGSKTTHDYIADANGDLIGYEDDDLAHFRDAPNSARQCQVPTNETDLFFFEGFLQTMSKHTMERVVYYLQKVYARFPGYSIVINGHSLGGAKAMLTAFYLSKFYSSTLPLKAVYTFGQPPVGSTNTNTWMAECIGPKKIVRVVASDDIVPWARVALNVQHPPNVVEVYNPDSNRNVWKRCMGANDVECSAGKLCTDRSWKHHSVYGGLHTSSRICQYGLGIVKRSP